MARKPRDLPYPYRSPYNDDPPPSKRELESLRRSMQEAKEHLRQLASS